MDDLKFPIIEAHLVEAEGEQEIEREVEEPERENADPARWLEPFEMTKEVEAFVKEYGLEGELEIEGDKEEEKAAALKPEIAQELANTDRLFKSHEVSDERMEGMDEAIKNKILEIGKAVAPNFTFEVEADPVDSDHGNPSHYWDVRLKKGDQEEALEILYYTYEPGINLSEGASSWNWAAWLGIPESPFYDEDFVTAYDEDYVTIAWDEMLATLNESGDKHDIEKAIKALEKNYEPVFTYHINLDERGQFSADVRDPDGKTVYEVKSEEAKGEPEEGEEDEGSGYGEGAIPQVEDGFMKNARDIKGLAKYLKELEIMPEKSELIMDDGR